MSHLHGMYRDEDIYDVSEPQDDVDLREKHPQHSNKANWYFPKFDR